MRFKRGVQAIAAVAVIIFLFALRAPPAVRSEVSLDNNFSEFGISFSYPSSMKLEKSERLDYSAETGALFGTCLNETSYRDSHALGVAWFKGGQQYRDAKAYLDEFFNGMNASLKDANMSSTPLGTSVINNYTIAYQNFTILFPDGANIYGVIGVWDASGMSFSIDVIAGDKEAAGRLFREYVGSFSYTPPAGLTSSSREAASGNSALTAALLIGAVLLVGVPAYALLERRRIRKA